MSKNGVKHLIKNFLSVGAIASKFSGKGVGNGIHEIKNFLSVGSIPSKFSGKALGITNIEIIFGDSNITPKLVLFDQTSGFKNQRLEFSCTDFGFTARQFLQAVP